jgi:nucleoid-associated protein YgaU
MGLVAGMALAGATLIGMATRPSWSPQPQPTPPVQEDNALFPPISPSPASVPKTNETKLEEPVRIEKILPAPQTSDSRAKTEPNQAPRFHVVRAGETLSGIAEQYYGSTNAWRKILTANRKTIKDANKIAPGTKLIIP